MLIAISNKRIIGTISIAGIIKTNNETVVAANPNPENPLIVEANNIIKQSNTKSWDDNSR